MQQLGWELVYKHEYRSFGKKEMEHIRRMAGPGGEVFIAAGHSKHDTIFVAAMGRENVIFDVSEGNNATFPHNGVFWYQGRYVFGFAPTNQVQVEIMNEIDEFDPKSINRLTWNKGKPTYMRPNKQSHLNGKVPCHVVFVLPSVAEAQRRLERAIVVKSLVGGRMASLSKLTMSKVLTDQDNILFADLIKAGWQPMHRQAYNEPVSADDLEELRDSCGPDDLVLVGAAIRGPGVKLLLGAIGNASTVLKRGTNMQGNGVNWHFSGSKFGFTPAATFKVDVSGTFRESLYTSDSFDKDKDNEYSAERLCWDLDGSTWSSSYGRAGASLDISSSDATRIEQVIFVMKGSSGVRKKKK
jgi:hypothetical protein